MPLLKLFDTEPVIQGDDSRNALQLLEISMNAFMTDPDIETEQVNGPYATYLPPTKELPNKERVRYTASLLYHSNSK